MLAAIWKRHFFTRNLREFRHFLLKWIENWGKHNIFERLTRSRARRTSLRSRCLHPKPANLHQEQYSVLRELTQRKTATLHDGDGPGSERRGRPAEIMIIERSLVDKTVWLKSKTRERKFGNCSGTNHENKYLRRPSIDQQRRRGPPAAPSSWSESRNTLIKRRNNEKQQKLKLHSNVEVKREFWLTANYRILRWSTLLTESYRKGERVWWFLNLFRSESKFWNFNAVVGKRTCQIT